MTHDKETRFASDDFDPLDIDSDADTTPPPPGDDRLGVEIIERAALRDAIRGLNSDWSDDNEDTSREEAARIKLLRQLHRGSLYKRHVFGTPALIARIEALRTDTPNFREAADVVRRAARLSLVTGTPMRIPPLLLLAPAGVGKTYFAQGLARALETSVTVLSGATMTDRGILTGLNTSWRGARPGVLGKALLAAPTISPVIVLDEVDKLLGLVAHESPLDALLTMLEPETSRSYRDEYLDVPMRADNVTWIMTANDLAALAAPLRDRLLVLRIPDLTPAQRADVHARIFAALNADLGDAFDLAPKALASLATLNTRRAKSVITQALGIAADEARQNVTATDISRAADLVLQSGSSRPTIGFGLPGRSVPRN